MNNVSKKTIREEIEKYNKEKGEDSKSGDILPANTSPTNPKEKIKPKAQTETSLSYLSEKSRGKSSIRGSAESSVKKMKKLEVKYERFDLIFKTWKLVRQKDKGVQGLLIFILRIQLYSKIFYMNVLLQ